MKISKFIMSTLLAMPLLSMAQGVGIGTNSPHPSAMLDIHSSNRGVLLPNAWLFNVDSSSPISPFVDIWFDYMPPGLLLYNNNPNSQNGLSGEGFYFWQDKRWNRIADKSISWKTNGNAITGTEKLGARDDTGMAFIRHGKFAGILNEYGTVFGNASNRLPSSGSLMTIFGAESLLRPIPHSTLAFGAYSLQLDSTGNFNTAIGAYSMALKKRGVNNTAIGNHALYGNQGSYNTAIGSMALNTNTTGNYNTGIGFNATALPAANFATAIGADATVNCNNCMALGGMGEAAVKVGIGTTTPTADLDIRQQADSAGIRLKASVPSSGIVTLVDNNGNLVFQRLGATWSYIDGATGSLIAVSDSSRKKEIETMPSVLDKVMSLQPKSYTYRHDETRTKTLGFLAQDVEKLFPEFVDTDGNGTKAVGYANFGIVAIKTIQEQQATLQQQDEIITKLRQRIASLEKTFMRQP